MIDIFEVQKLIDSKPENSDLDTICMSVNNRRDLNQYFVDGKYKGFYILGLSIINDESMYMGIKPRH